MTDFESQTPEQLRRVVAEQEDHIAKLRERVSFLERREAEQREALRHARAGLDGKGNDDAGAIRECERRIAQLDDEVRALNRTIQMMQATKAWQLGERYWRGRDAAKRLLRRA